MGRRRGRPRSRRSEGAPPKPLAVPPNGLAFGLAPQDWTSRDRIGYDQVDPFGDVPLLTNELEDGDANEILDFGPSLALLVGGLRPSLENHAQHLILTAAVNDVLALVDRVIHLDGRSAAHDARALFEHLVNLADIRTSTTNTPQRFVEHKWVTQDQIARHRGMMDLLEPASRRRELARLERIGRQARKYLPQALKTYGRYFRRQWAEGTLQARAQAHHFEEGYEGYRILSGVIHGSSGAMAGVTRDTGKQIIHRTGPDLELAATAWVEGLHSFYQLADMVTQITGTWEAEEIKGRTGKLIRMWPSIRAALRKIDHHLWPQAAPPPPMAILAFYPGPTKRWYYFNIHEDTLLLADPPDPEPDLTVYEEHYRTYDPSPFNGRPMTVIMPTVRVVPKPGQTPVPADSILVPPDHPARRLEPRPPW